LSSNWPLARRLLIQELAAFSSARNSIESGRLRSKVRRRGLRCSVYFANTGVNTLETILPSWNCSRFPMRGRARIEIRVKQAPTVSLRSVTCRRTNIRFASGPMPSECRAVLHSPGWALKRWIELYFFRSIQHDVFAGPQRASKTAQGAGFLLGESQICARGIGRTLLRPRPS
jgi:hypothetical protein